MADESLQLLLVLTKFQNPRPGLDPGIHVFNG
jgi:hypothetical protein